MNKLSHISLIELRDWSVERLLDCSPEDHKYFMAIFGMLTIRIGDEKVYKEVEEYVRKKYG